MPITIAAPAKLNLFLHVVGKRDDGFHLLDSLIAFTAIHDTVQIVPAERLTLSVNGPTATGVPTDDRNLVLKAAHALQSVFGISAGAAIHLTKRLPAAAGIGGGSSDAAAALRGLCRLWEISPTEPRLADIALALGADVPMCLAGAAAFAGGIGDDLEMVSALPVMPLVLVNPGVPVETPTVFRARHGPFSDPGRFSDTVTDGARLAALLAQRHNDLGPPAESLAPIIRDARFALEVSPGNLLARMSGSGATCFGLFGTEIAAQAAAVRIAAERPDWWVVASRLVSDVMEIDPQP